MDTRDFKVYWVAKLKDNNCWMTQNLDYDDPNAGRYERPDSILEDYGAWPENGNTKSKYYDPGLYYYTNVDSWTACIKVADGLADPTCATAGWTTTGDDAHFMVGNYYNWLAATNGSGVDMEPGEEAPDSICPKGWGLPLGGVADRSGSFVALATAYSGVDKATDILRKNPLYFVPSGSVRSETGALDYAGSAGSYWSSTNTNSTIAHRLKFSANELSATGNSDRASGVSVRCVAK